MQENMDQAAEISELLGQPMGDEADEDELMDELNELEAEVMEEQMMKQSEPAAADPSAAYSLPSVPDTAPMPSAPTAEDDEDALAALEAEMA